MRAYERKGVLVQGFSDEEDGYLTALRIAGNGTTAIARAVSERFGRQRSAATINMRLKTLANKAESPELPQTTDTVRRYDGGTAHTDWCRDAHEGKCLDWLLEKLSDRRDQLAVEWLTARHSPEWYIGDATRAEWEAAYDAVDAASLGEA